MTFRRDIILIIKCSNSETLRIFEGIFKKNRYFTGKTEGNEIAFMNFAYLPRFGRPQISPFIFRGRILEKDKSTLLQLKVRLTSFFMLTFGFVIVTLILTLIFDEDFWSEKLFKFTGLISPLVIYIATLIGYYGRIKHVLTTLKRIYQNSEIDINVS